jgi:hypothetical protein
VIAAWVGKMTAFHCLNTAIISIMLRQLAPGWPFSDALSGKAP